MSEKPNPMTLLYAPIIGTVIAILLMVCGVFVKAGIRKVMKRIRNARLKSQPSQSGQNPFSDK